MVATKQETSLWLRRNRSVAALIGVLGVGMFFMLQLEEPPLAEAIYNAQLQDGGQCLDNTPYDTADGARLQTSPASDNDESILTVTPNMHDSSLPVLHLLLNKQTVEGKTTYFTPTDYQTGELLYQKCDYTTGY